jgi:hypothetical protein
MKCKDLGCNGDVTNGSCQICGAIVQQEDQEGEALTRQSVFSSVREILQAKEVSPSREELSKAAQALKTVVPYNYEAWRLHADLLLNALRQIEKRQLQPDSSFTILAIPLREDDLREAAEESLRECAHYADSLEKRIALVDEANSIRRLTWF